LFVLEVFRDNVDFLLRLDWDQRWNSFDASQGRFCIFLGGCNDLKLELRLQLRQRLEEG